MEVQLRPGLRVVEERVERLLLVEKVQWLVQLPRLERWHVEERQEPEARPARRHSEVQPGHLVKEGLEQLAERSLAQVVQRPGVAPDRAARLQKGEAQPRAAVRLKVAVVGQAAHRAVELAAAPSAARSLLR